MGSSILASLSEAGGNDPHKSRSKPLPPRSKTREDRLSECTSVSLLCTPRSNPRRFPAPGIPCVCSSSSRTSSQNCARFRLRGLIWESWLPPRECPGDFPDAMCGMHPNRIPLIQLNQRVKVFARPDSANLQVKATARRTPSPFRWRDQFSRAFRRGLPRTTASWSRCYRGRNERQIPLCRERGASPSCRRFWSSKRNHAPLVPAHRKQTAKQESSSIPIWNSEQYFHHEEPYIGQPGD